MNAQNKLYKNDIQVTPVYPIPSLYDHLKKLLNENPEKLVLKYINVENQTDEEISVRDFFDKINKLMYLFSNRYKLKKGDAVAIHLMNSPWILYVNFACWCLGLVSVPLDLKRDDSQRKIYKIKQTECKLIISNPDQELNELAISLNCIQILLTNEISWTNVDHIDVLTDSNPENDALILYTSGTTSLPKGVKLTLANLVYNADGIREWLKLGENDKFLIVLPLHHINSTTMCLATLLASGTIILTSRYTKSGFWQIAAKNKATLSSIVPTVCFDLLSENDTFESVKEQLSQLSRIQIGSSPVMVKDVIKFMDLYKIPLVQGYGSTETALRVSGVFEWDKKNDKYAEQIKSNSIGSELKWNNLSIQAENGTELGELERGEICIRGPVIFKEYIKNSKATGDAFRGGWFHSGDQGYWKYLNGQKCYFITGRIKEIIIKGGVNLSPTAIENALLNNFPEIEACFVAGISDQRFGQVVGAAVVFRSEIPESQKRIFIDRFEKKSRDIQITGLSDYEAPSRIFEIPFKLLPQTSTGKVQRVNLSDYFSEHTNIVAENNQYFYRRLTLFDWKIFVDILRIYNSRWPVKLNIDEITLAEAIKNGTLIGQFEKENGEVFGVLFLMILKESELNQSADSFKSFDVFTDNLKLNKSLNEGDCAVLVSIANKGKAFKDFENIPEKDYLIAKSKAENLVDDYLNRNIDPVINFHKSAKAGANKGAELLRLFKNARENDRPSAGMVALVKYPEITKAFVNDKSSPGTQMVESSMQYCNSKGISKFYALTRPAGILSWIINNQSDLES